jgi:hypothetical protein
MGASYNPIPTLLGRLKSANMNSTADQPIVVGITKYIIRRIIVQNSSASLTLAAGGLYTAAAKGGDVIVPATQIYSALTVATKFLDLTLAAILNTDVRTESTLYLSLTVAQGVAATADLFILGDILEP